VGSAIGGDIGTLKKSGFAALYVDKLHEALKTFIAV